jgi:hypothetical protein
MRKLAGAATCGLLLLLAAGCGGSDDAATETATVAAPSEATSSTTPSATSADAAPAADKDADQAIVDAALLKLDDFPSGWTGHPADDEDDDPEAWSCPGLDDLDGKTTAKGSSPDFENDSNEQVTESIAVFPDENLPHQFLSALGNQDFLDCMEDKVLDEIESDASEEDVTLGDVKLSQLRVNDRGDESAAIRVAIPMEIQGITLDAAVDVIAVRVGRSVLMLMTAGVMSPVSDADRENLTTVATKRLAAAMS